MGVLRRLPLRDLENSLPKCGAWGSPPSEGSGQKIPQSSPGAQFCQEKGPETGMQRAVSAQGCLWAWPQKNNQVGLIGGGGEAAVGEGGEGITLRSLLVPNR